MMSSNGSRLHELQNGYNISCMSCRTATISVVQTTEDSVILASVVLAFGVVGVAVLEALCSKSRCFSC